jgi:hypothetical protein
LPTGRYRRVAHNSFQEAAMKATVKRGSKRRLKTGKEVTRDLKKTATRKNTTKRSVHYPISETLRWVADGERLLIKWGAIKSPGAKRVANTVGNVMAVLEALMQLRKT